MAEPSRGRRRLGGAGWAIATAALLAGCATTSSGALGGPAGGPAGQVGTGDRTDPASEAAEVLGRFTTALRAGRFGEAWPLLSTRWRERTTPEQLAADWRGGGSVPAEAADRVASLLASGARPALAPARPGQPRSCALAVGPGRAARLIEQPGGWRVDALE
jgi:hypothetical protein